jgi:hypothetical protein
VLIAVEVSMKAWRLALTAACITSLGLGACAALSSKPEHAEADLTPHDNGASTGPVHISLPRDSTAVRDDKKAPILEVATSGNVVFPKVYGYPIYPEGEGSQGLTLLRRDNWDSVRKIEKKDDSGVVHEIEEYADLGCRFDGIRENVNKYVPLSLTCELPAPRALGGSRRPVLNGLMTGAKAEQVLKDKTVEDVFLGAFHLTSDDFDEGSGVGYFNTTHGQLAFAFARKKLTRFIYYFDPSVKGWQNPTLWVKP